MPYSTLSEAAARTRDDHYFPFNIPAHDFLLVGARHRRLAVSTFARYRKLLLNTAVWVNIIATSSWIQLRLASLMLCCVGHGAA
jgi:hypothetical protein